MVFVNSPWDNCNIRWIVHSGLPVSVCWVSGVWYSGTRMQKCRVKAPRLSSDLQYIPVCSFSPIAHSKAVLWTDLKGMGWRIRQKLKKRQKKNEWVSWKIAWAKLPYAQNSQQHLRTRASMCLLHALYTRSTAP